MLAFAFLKPGGTAELFQNAKRRFDALIAGLAFDRSHMFTRNCLSNLAHTGV
jgi:hypothetical protein